MVNGSLIDPPEESTLDAYLTLYGRPGRTVSPGRLAFRRADGNILLLPPTIRPYLAAFAEPTTLAEATDRVGLGRLAADRLWAIMLRQGSLRQYRPARVPVLAGSTVDYR